MEGKEAQATGVMIINQDNQVLLGRRMYNNQEMWSMPGGKVDKGESIMECAIREVKEECNLDITNLQEVCAFEHHNKDKNIYFTTTGYLTSTYSGNLNNNEPEVFVEWRWFDLDDLPNSLFEPSRIISGKSGLL